MRPIYAVVLVIALTQVLVGCKAKVSATEDSEPNAVGGEVAKPGGLLAYEHEVSFEVAPDSIARRIAVVQAACNDERFGACSVLGIASTAGEQASGAISVRVVPAGVEKLVALAGEGSGVAQRQTKAEDLADAVADVAGQQDLLTRQRASLLGFIERKDLPVADLITVAQQLASVESQLQALSQTAAQQRRRIETNHLQISLQSNIPYEPPSDFTFAGAWGTFVDSLAEGADNAAESAGYLLPLAILFFPLALLWRWAWRFATRATRGKT